MTDEIPQGSAPAQAETTPQVTQTIERPSSESLAQTPPSDPVTQPQTTAEPQGFAVPESYKDKGWARNIKSEDDVWKMLENSQALAGKKFAVPDLNSASEDDVSAYYNELRPKDKAEYVFADGTPDEVKGAYAEMFHKNGLSVKQQEGLAKDFMEMATGVQGSQTSSEGYVEEMKSSFGDNYEKRAGEITLSLAALMPKEDQAKIDSMPNAQLGIMYRFMDKVLQKYGVTEGTAAANNAAGVTGVTDIKEKRNELYTKLNDMKGKRVPVEEKNAMVQQYIKSFEGVK